MSEYVETDYPSTRPTPSGSEGSEEASAKDKAMQSAQAGKQAAGDMAQTAVSKAQDVVGEGKAQARNLVGDARDQLRGHAGEQHRNAVTSLRSLGDELRSMAQSGQGGVATDLVSQAADRTHGVASWLDGREPEDLLEELRRFARRRPGAFLAGALAAGVLAGHLTRGAVAAHTDDDQAEQRPTRGPGAGGLEDPARRSYGAGPAGSYGGQPGSYAGGQSGGEPGWEPTSSGPYSGPGVTP
jgi:hypothetical protein